MIVLGISPLDKDTTTCVLKDGKILYAIGEERLSRTKLQGGFPRLSLPHTLEQCGLTAADIDVVAYPFHEWQEERRLINKGLRDELGLNFLKVPGESHRHLRQAKRDYTNSKGPHGVDMEGYDEFMNKPPLKRFMHALLSGNPISDALTHQFLYLRWARHAIADHRKLHEELIAGLQQTNLIDKLVRVEHHTAHCANAFYTSSFDRALIVTIDAYGSGRTGRVSLGQRGKAIEPLGVFDFPHSFGVYYEQLTSALGFKPSRHEGKILGLAAYGDPSVLRETLRARFNISGTTLTSQAVHNQYFPRYLANHFSKVDVAAAHQTVMEEICTEVVQKYVDQTGCENIVLSGGVTANVKLNQRLHSVRGVHGLFVHPSMGDGGTGTGAALHVFEENGGIEPYKMPNAYLGPEFTDEELTTELKKEDLAWERPDDLEDEVGRLISEGYVVARFNGRMEYGPRALGNRSILYHATERSVNKWLNQNLGRTEFMPFAPATMAEHAGQCYERLAGAEHTAEFMTVTFDCTEFMTDNCPAAVHVDGTARPQLVSAESNLSFYRIIEAYHKRTGIPSVINTSFNMHEEPIVCTPYDAIRAFKLGHLDYLALGPFLVKGDSTAERRPSRSIL